MPTIPRRWPAEVESERTEALRAASDSITKLQKAQENLDAARSKINLNQSLAIMLLADTERYVADAMTCMERIKRYMLLAKASPINGRWPMVVSKQRDEIDNATDVALDLLTQVQESLSQARKKVNLNPSLAEAIVADVAQYQAKAATQAERIVRLLIEVGIGRD